MKTNKLRRTSTGGDVARLQRTFSVATPPRGGAEADDYSFMGASGALAWPDLLRERIVVVLGEAGVGKTVELQERTRILKSEGQFAFFLSLSRLRSRELPGALDDSTERKTYDAWFQSRHQAHFFLDAVDEAQLESLDVLVDALRNFVDSLGSRLSRASVVVSCRGSDWYGLNLGRTVDRYLIGPLARALPRQRVVQNPDGSADSLPVSSQRNSSETLNAYVVRLDPLSDDDAKTLSYQFGVKDPDSFWEVVRSRGYRSMATRPLDLRWMAKTWIDEGALGTYAEFMHTAVTQRLLAPNERREKSIKAVAPEKLLAGVETLSATCLLTGQLFVRLDRIDGQEGRDSFCAAEVLPDWRKAEVETLLSSGIFDGESFGRVWISDRKTRDYLSAQWVKRLIANGLSKTEMRKLFVRRVFGDWVGVAANSSMLGWLASFDASARDLAIEHAPEFLLFWGDAQGLGASDLELTLVRLIEKIRAGYHVSRWQVDETVFRRIGAQMDRHAIARLLKYANDVPIAETLIVAIIDCASITEAVPELASLYADDAVELFVKVHVVRAFDTLGRDQDYATIKADLLGGKLQYAALGAAACELLFPRFLAPGELLTTLLHSTSDRSLSFGEMSRAFNFELIPKMDLRAATTISEGLLQALIEPAEQYEHRYANDNPREDGWLLNTLSYLLNRILDIVEGESHIPDVALALAMRIDALADSAYVERREFVRLHTNIERFAQFRKNVVMRCAAYGKSNFPVRLVAPRGGAVVTLGANDIAWIQGVAADKTRLQPESDAAFELLRMLTARHAGKRREKILNKTARARDTSARLASLRSEQESRQSSAALSEKFDREAEERRTESDQQFQASVSTLRQHIDSISDGSNVNALWYMAQQVQSSSSGTKLSDVDFDAMRSRFGAKLTKAAKQGLRLTWRNWMPPAYAEGAGIPARLVLGLAGIALELRDPIAAQSAPGSEAEQLALYAIHELNGAPDWFADLAASHPDIVACAISPAVVRELQACAPTEGYSRFLEILRRSPDALCISMTKMLSGLAKGDRIASPFILSSLLKLMRDKGAISAPDLRKIVKSRFSMAAKAGLSEHIAVWFSLWAEWDAMAAWASLRRYVESHKSQTEAIAEDVGNRTGSTFVDDVIAGNGPAVAATLLAEIYVYMRNALLPENELHRAGGAAYSPTKRDHAQEARDRMLTAISRIPGACANSALIRLRDMATVRHEQEFVSNLILEHATAEAERENRWSPHQVAEFGNSFFRTPRTEAELFDFALARIADIRLNVEEGPFSEREILARVGRIERNLQLWFAAKLHQWPQRAYATTREEELDARKKSDIQLRLAGHAVCVEIKTLGRTCGKYSAADLVDTLERQLVRQYLRGSNSKHGVLLLFLVEPRKWTHPKTRQKLGLSQLVEYLNDEAKRLLRTHPDLGGLEVVAIDCTEPFALTKKRQANV